MMHEDSNQYLRETPWPEIRERIRSTARAGGIRNLEVAASLGTLADYFAIMPEQERVLDEVWDALRYAHHPVSWLAPRLLKPERRDEPLGHYDLPHPEWNEPQFDTALPSGVDQIEGPFPIDTESIQLTRMHDRGMPFTYVGACFLTPPGEQIGQRTVQLMISTLIPTTPILRGCTGSFASRVHPDDLLRRFIEQALRWPVPDETGYAGSRLLAWRSLATLVGLSDRTDFSDVVREVAQDRWLAVNPLMERVYYPESVSNCYAHANESRGETMIVMWDNGSY